MGVGAICTEPKTEPDNLNNKNLRPHSWTYNADTKTMPYIEIVIFPLNCAHKQCLFQKMEALDCEGPDKNNLNA